MKQTARKFQGVGVAADLVRAKDWSGTSLGAVEEWPQLLFDTVNLVLSAPLPMQVYWGPDSITIYNDGLIPALGKRGLAKFLGCPARETWASVWNIIGEQIERVVRTGRAERFERFAVQLHPDSVAQQMYWNRSYVPLFQADGTVAGVLHIAQDVTQAVLDEEALRTSQQEFDLGMEAACLGMWHYDPKTEVVSADERMQRIFGAPERSGTVDYWLAMLHPEDRQRVGDHFTGALAGKHFYEIDYRILRNGEIRWARSMGRLIGPKDHPERMFAVVEDITTRKLGEAALQQNEKLAAMGRLAASIAHEINNPLESITNLLYLMHGSGELSEIHGYVETAERELRRMALITNQTLRFHRQSTKPVPAFCYDLIGDSLSMFQGRLLNNRIQVEKRDRTEQPIDCLDGEIRQVLNNLIGNAIDAMPLGGRLLLRSRAATDPQTGEKALVITVADTGSGMSPETQKRVFEAFYSTKGIGGTGLGLWISKDILARHRGKLQFRSCTNPGRSGTVFTLALPFGAAPIPQA